MNSIKLSSDNIPDLEVSYDTSSVSEMCAIDAMVTHATVEGLLTEVLWSFGQGIKEGLSLESATSYALCEWDI